MKGHRTNAVTRVMLHPLLIKTTHIKLHDKGAAESQGIKYENHECKLVNRAIHLDCYQL